MATNTSPQSLRPPIDPSLANFIGMASAAIILVAFLFAPWYWGDMEYNGGRLMSEAVVRGSWLKDYVSLHIVLVPVAALLTIVITLWGLNSPERGKTAAAATAGFGLLSLIYFINFFFIDNNELIQNTVIDSTQYDTGFRLALAGSVGLILQLLALRPPALSFKLALPRLYNRQRLTPYLFLAVPLALYLVWIIIPTGYTFYLSLTDWSGVSGVELDTKPHYIGFENYEQLFDDPNFKVALKNNVRWFAIFITVPTTLGLALALILNTEMRGGRWYKVSFYSPLVLSGPVIAMVWSWIYNPKNGLINTLLVDGGLTDNPPSWLADSQIAIYCIIAAAVWRQVGYVMVLYLAGLKNLDPTLLDAALVDGANRWQLFRRVIFPLLAPITTIIVIISIIDSLRAFDLVQIMTRGNQNTEVLANLMYTEAFTKYRMGYGAAIAVVLFTLSIFFVGIYLWRSLKDELEY